MKWYKDLYVGESISEKSAEIKWKILHNAGQIQIYVISMAEREGDLLDIIPAVQLMQKYYPKKDLFILGLAKGWEEATEVAASIVMEVYEHTGSFDVDGYFKKKKNGYRGTG